MEVCVIRPTSVDDARAITESLLSGRTVILNLEGLDLEVAPVSYTHLDVYKRQGLSSIVSLFSGIGVVLNVGLQPKKYQ